MGFGYIFFKLLWAELQKHWEHKAFDEPLPEFRALQDLTVIPLTC